MQLKTSAIAIASLSLSAFAAHGVDSPLKALYVTGGGWHDYKGQIPAVEEILEKAIPGIEVTVSKVEGHDGDHVRHPAFADQNWADGYDIVVYNICNAPRWADTEWIERIVAPHREGIPAVIIHGTLHNFWPDLDETKTWAKFCGVASRNHERHAPVTVTVDKPVHPIMKGLPETWTYEQGELYRIHGMEEGVETLATGVSSDGKEHCVVWTHHFGEGRVFGTSIGHVTETFKTDWFQTMVAQGVRWALEK